MKAQRIKIQLIGSISDREDVRLEDFIDQLNRVKKALNEAEMTLTGLDSPTIDYKVVDLQHDSPSTVILEPIALNGRPPVIEIPEVPKYFASELRAIRRGGELLHKPELARLEAYQKIGARNPYRKNSYIEKVKIGFNRKTVTIDQKFQRNLEVIVGPDEESEGSISGHLEAINLHNTNRFTLYPPIGPKRISGTFPINLRPQIKQAIESFVTIYGKLKFKAWSELPHAVTAREVDIHEADRDLPNLSEMRGAFRGMTGSLNSAEFMDELRGNTDAW